MVATEDIGGGVVVPEGDEVVVPEGDEGVVPTEERVTDRVKPGSFYTPTCSPCFVRELTVDGPCRSIYCVPEN